MYYELYIDVFFLVNFMMDIMVLSVSKKILKCQVSERSICLGAITGAVLACILLFVPRLGDGLGFIIFQGLISSLMIRTGLRIRFHRGFWKAYIVVYISSFLLGGVLLCMMQYTRKGSLFFVFAVFGYLVVKSIWQFIFCIGKCRNVSCDVLLINGDNQVKVKALIDTGNRLYDLVSGKPVSIISGKTAKKMWKEMPMESLRYIPYQTIGEKSGVLPILFLEKICLYQEEERWISGIYVAICEDEIGTGEYEMILNPDI